MAGSRSVRTSSRATPISRLDALQSLPAYSFLDVVRALARAELDDANVHQALRVERVLFRDCFNRLAALADGEDDPAVTRNLAAGHQEVPCRVVLAHEFHVRGHVRVDLLEIGLVDELDDEHGCGGYRARALSQAFALARSHSLGSVSIVAMAAGVRSSRSSR